MSSGSDTTVVSLPSGGGAVRGIGETFQPNLFTGTGNFSVPIATSPGRKGFGPALSLQYSSGNGNGLFGLGWALSIPRISRKTEQGLPRYDGTDTYVASGIEDLVPSAAVTHRSNHLIQRYRPRTESMFSRIERWEHDASHAVHWRAVTKDNVTSIYGTTSRGRISDPIDDTRVFEWLLEETFDAYGNHILYEYACDDSGLYNGGSGVRLDEVYEQNRTAVQRYLRRIYYGNLPSPLINESGALVTYPDGGEVGHLRRGRRFAFEVVFDYGDWNTAAPHPVPLDNDVPELFGREVPLRDDRFSHSRAGFEIRTLRRCARVLMFHHFAELGGPTLVRSTDFHYRTDPETLLSFLASAGVTGYRKTVTGTYETAVVPPSTFAYSEFRPREQRYQKLAASGNEMPRSSLDDPNVALVDLFGDGLPDILESTAAGLRYWRNLGDGIFDRPRSISQIPAGLVLSQPGVAFGDMDGDGRIDLLVMAGPRPGFYEATMAGTWTTFRAFERLPSFSPDDRDVRLVDLTGDGRTDVLKTAADAFIWCECLGEGGYGPPQIIGRRRDLEAFPDVFFDDPRVRLADMTGDGLHDIVFVHANRVEYWPNLGYGRFGARVVMSESPRFDGTFEPKRLILADVNGTGCADIIYVDSGRIHVWFNRSGNGWSQPTTVEGTPPVTNADTVRVADLFGTGTSALVWSYPFTSQPDGNYKALDLCGGVKPYVLVESSNGLGATTRVTYVSSTRHFLADQVAGTPWKTKLPFPVQVVDRVDVIDHVGQSRLTTRFKYHDGYFDGREREFRGFARVDRFDAEERDLAANGAPAVETRTWFHTGAYLDEDPTPGDHEVEEGDAPFQAYRALRGAPVRTEVYARDGSTNQDRPYTVTETRHRVVCLQAAGEHHAVYFRHAVEELSYQYERDPGAPRIAHTLTLAIDEWGSTTRSVAVGYGRRHPDPSLPRDEDRDVQARTHITYQTTEFTNAIDRPDEYRAPLECARRTYELSGFTPAGVRFTAGDFALADAASELAFEATSAGNVEAKRLVSHVRTYFRTDDLTSLLPLGVLEPLALAGAMHRLAFTPGLVADIYGDRVDDTMLQIAGGYIRSEGDTGWWVSSGRTFFSLDPAHSAIEELARARRMFFLPQRFRDSFGNETLTAYDAYCMTPTRTSDPVGNQTTAACDYRVLQPFRVTDPNGNQTELVFDALGLVTATAVMGKPGTLDGDDLVGVVPDVSRAELDAFYVDPIARAPLLLGRATKRTLRDVDRFQAHGAPTFEATLTRDRHVNESGVAAIQISFAYSDGFGRNVQSKGLVGATQWLGSGATVFNNKGKPVKTYEPFFDDTHAFRPATNVGASSTVFYDPVERVVGSLRADHTWSKVSFDAWRREDWDEHDTSVISDPKTDPDLGAQFRTLADGDYLPTWHAMREAGQRGPIEQTAARKTAVHARTPSIAHADALGRTFLTIGHNRFERSGAIVEESGATRFRLDIDGNIRAVLDARDRVVMRNDFDLLGRRIYLSNLDAGERRFLSDVGGHPIYAWDGRGHRLRTMYDRASRPVETWLSSGGGAERLIGRTMYGEDAVDPVTANLRGRATQIHDQAGIVTIERYDFKGNTLASTRRLAAGFRELVDWSTNPSLEAESYTQTFEYDALNRVIARIAPDGSRQRESFNLAGQLERVEILLPGTQTAVPTVASIAYNPRGQRTRIDYGNGVATEYHYDPLTFRTVKFETRRATDNAVLQSIGCTYDAGGRITFLRDGASSTIYFNNQIVAADNDYTYDAFYQLIGAQGREHIGQVPQTSWDDRGRSGLPHPNDGQAMRRYDETYRYDLAGNIAELVHRASGADWTRRYEYAATSNRAVSTAVGATVEQYAYDAHGNTTLMAHAPALAWDHRDQLRRVELSGGGTAFYVYDGAGRRVRKIVEKNGGSIVDERIDLGGFEIFQRRTGSGSIVARRETLHVTDDEQRVALVETQTIDEGAPVARRPRYRYQCTNRLGGAALELDAGGLVISYEEYYPFGGTSYQAVRSEIDKPKRYRQAAKERDEETGFVYFGARYFAPWLGRWISADPAMVDGTAGVAFDQSAYAFCSNDPINRIDPTGRLDYYTGNGEFVGNDGKANDNEFLMLLDRRDANTVRERYMGGWWRRNLGWMLSLVVGLVVGVVLGLLGVSAGWAIAAALGVGGGGVLANWWLHPLRPGKSTAASQLVGETVAPPPMAVRQAAKGALERSNRPSPPGPDGSPLMDTLLGQHHEEGGFWGEQNGTFKVGQARPGPYKDPKQEGVATVDVFSIVNDFHPDTVHGTFHVHPAGYEEVRTTGTSSGGATTRMGTDTTTPFYYEQEPSDGDIANVTERMTRTDDTRQTGYSFVVGARSGEVYFYDQRNTPQNRYFAKIPASRFFQGTK